MDTAILDWLARVGSAAIVWSLVLFVLVNLGAVVLFLSRRDRDQVNRWVGRVLAVDLLLLGAGIGIPLVTGTLRVAISVVAAPFSPASSVQASMFPHTESETPDP